MTLERAKLIAALIADLNKDCVYNDYVAEVKQNASREDEYSVKLSSKASHRDRLSELFFFARDLVLLAPFVHMNCESNYIELA